MPRASAGGTRTRWPPGIRIRDSGRPIGIYRAGLITEFYNTGLGSTLSLHRTSLSKLISVGLFSGSPFSLFAEDPERVARFDDEYKNGWSRGNAVYRRVRLNDLPLSIRNTTVNK